MKKKNEQLHLRDYGYSIKFPKIFRIRAIKKKHVKFLVKTKLSSIYKKFVSITKH